MKPRRLLRTIVYESRWVNLYLDKVLYPGGRVIDEHHLLHFPRASVVVLVEDDRERLLCVRLCRYTIGCPTWELPAGWAEEGESVLEAARREALEETGYHTGDHEEIYSYYPMSGIADSRMHVVRCRAAAQSDDFDWEEVNEVRWHSREEVRALVEGREVLDGLSLTAMLLWLG